MENDDFEADDDCHDDNETSRYSTHSEHDDARVKQELVFIVETFGPIMTVLHSIRVGPFMTVTVNIGVGPFMC